MLPTALAYLLAAAAATGCGGLEPSSDRFDDDGPQNGTAGSPAQPNAGSGAASSPATGGSGSTSGQSAPPLAGASAAGTGGSGAAGGDSPPPGDAGVSGSDAAIDVDPSGSDDIYGQQIPRSEAWWVAGGRIHRGGQQIRLFGLNWFGLETQTLALFGPAQAGRSVADFLSQVKSLGFNALRVPLAPESINPGFPSAGWANHGSVDTGREHFEALAQAAHEAGIYMLWDVHTCAASVGHLADSPHDPACGGYGDADWLTDLRTLAGLAEQYAPHVLGIDLFNEPYGLTHDAWRALAEQGGRAVLEENPGILVFVEGVGGESYQGSDWPFWGEDLTGVASSPVDLPGSRLVYSPHVYGPSVSDQAYFGAGDFPSNMPAIWDEHFGYLFGAQAVVPGEFGGFYDGEDRVWQDAFVDYLIAKDAPGFFYWCLNPNSGDTGGLLQDDWRSVNMDKLALLQRLMQ